ncbi:MAG: hypothetical protein JWP91_4364 [Fibrobacteres bacterium]|nr:hypothetical protein [Fibrobacterota bacterium]
MVPFNLAATARRPDFGHLVSREAGDLATRFLADRPRFRFWLDLAARRGFHLWFERFEAFMVPGMALHQALRNLSLEEAAIHGLEAGMEQVLILGGGFNTLAARLARRYPQARFLEIDRPSALAAKRRVLGHSGFLAPNLSLIPWDFRRTDLGAALMALPGFHPREPAFFLCEGVLMHFDPKAAENLFDQLAALPCPALRFAFTFMEPDGNGAISFRGASRLLAAWQRLRGQRFTWGLSTRDLGSFLARRGFALEEVADAGVFRKRFLFGVPDVALAEGEKVAIASLVRR